MRKRRGRQHLLILALTFTIATVALTWPLSPQLWDHVVDARIYGASGAWWRQDIFLNLWILSWGTHALTTAPLQMWNGNVLVPMNQALAGSEHMLGYQFLFAPLYLLTDNPVFATQALTLLSFVFTGVAMALLARELTGSAMAGWLAGCVLAFSPWRFNELTRVQLLATFYLPLIVLCLSRYLRLGNRRYLLALSGLLAMQTLTSFYLGYFAFLAIGLLLLPSLLTRALTTRQWGAIAAAVGSAAILVVPMSLPYLRLRASGVIPNDPYEQPMAILFLLAAEPWSRFFMPGTELYLGVTTLAHSALGCRRLEIEMWPGRAALLTLAAGGYILAQGPAWPIGAIMVPLPYRILGWFVPGMSAVRYPLRFGILVTLAVAALAARGSVCVMHLVAARLPDVRKLVAVGLSIAIIFEGRRFPGAHLRLEMVPVGAAVPAVYHWLRIHGEGEVCVEIPVGDDSFPGFQRESRYMYFSTYHWLPLVNGFTGYPAPESTELRTVARHLPDPGALTMLRERAKVRWVVVHHAELDAAADLIWQAAEPAWRKVAEFGDDRVFDIGQG